jgi:hypothetical protein
MNIRWGVAAAAVVLPIGAYAAMSDNGKAFDFFNSNWTAVQQFASTSSGFHRYGSATVGISRYSDGSGYFGAPFTDSAAFFKALKTGPISDSKALGEVDGLYAYTQQHGVGDTGGLLADVNIVGSEGGGAVGAEVTASRLDASGAKILQARFVGGYIEGKNPLATAGDLECWIGPCNGIRLGTYDLHKGSNGKPPTMVTAIQVRSGRDDQNTVFRLAGPDDTFPGAAVFGTPNNNIYIWYDRSSRQLSFLGTNGSKRLASLSQDGAFTVTGGSHSIVSGATPARSHSPCISGQIGWDQKFIYVCVAKNSWKRSPLSDW